MFDLGVARAPRRGGAVWRRRGARVLKFLNDIFPLGCRDATRDARATKKSNERVERVERKIELHGVATLVDGPTLAGGDDVVGARGEGVGARGGAVGVRGVGARLGGGASGDLF